MTMLSLLETALLLGVYVALAGSYGIIYALARLLDVPALQRVSAVVYGLHSIAALAIIGWTPLNVGWKALIAASSVAFLAIPPITWRFLQRTHETEA
jgi:hypothetical protein